MAIGDSEPFHFLIPFAFGLEVAFAVLRNLSSSRRSFISEGVIGFIPCISISSSGEISGRCRMKITSSQEP